MRLDSAPEPALESLKWPGRPDLADGNLAWTYMVEIPERKESFAILSGKSASLRCRSCGSTARTAARPRRDRQSAVDGHAQRRSRVAENEARCAGACARRTGLCNSDAAERRKAMAERRGLGVRQHRAAPLRAACVFKDLDQHPTPMLNALFSKKEPKAGPLGTMSWTVDISNANTGDDFVLGVKELHLPDGSRRPYSIWLAGEYPKVLDGLCKLISLDMRVVDANWIGLKLKKLLNFGEQNGEFWAPMPGAERSTQYPSTVATSPPCCCIDTKCSASSTMKAARFSRPGFSRCRMRSS